jgi:hypothetical protein
VERHSNQGHRGVREYGAVLLMPWLWRALGLKETLGDPLRRSNVERPVAEALLALVTSRMTMPHSQPGFYDWLREKVYARTGKDWSYTIFTAVWIFWLNRHHLKIEENGEANINWRRVEVDARRDGKYVLPTGTDLTTEEVALAHKEARRVEHAFGE